jgi:hypothetical protein
VAPTFQQVGQNVASSSDVRKAYTLKNQQRLPFSPYAVRTFFWQSPYVEMVLAAFGTFIVSNNSTFL